MAFNKVTLNICSSRYTVVSEESEEYLQSLAEKMDKDMNELMSRMPTASVTSAAIITALGYLDELKKETAGTDNMRSQVHEYLEDAARARSECLEKNRRIAALEKELQALKAQRS